MKNLTLLLVIFVFTNCQAQSNTVKKKEIKFDQAWIWEYTNTTVPEDEIGHKGEVWVYYNEKLQYWLFTAESYGITGEMFNWILAKPDGTYIIDFTDEFGKTGRLEMKAEVEKSKLLPEHYVANGKSNWYNQEDLGFPKFKGDGYSVTYEMVNDTSEFYLAPNEKLNFAPIYLFNQLDSDAKLPIFFPVDLPGNWIYLEESTQMPQGEIQVKLTTITPTEYYINL